MSLKTARTPGSSTSPDEQGGTSWRFRTVMLLVVILLGAELCFATAPAETPDEPSRATTETNTDGEGPGEVTAEGALEVGMRDTGEVPASAVCVAVVRVAASTCGVY